MFKKMNRISKPTWYQSVNKQEKLNINEMSGNIIAKIGLKIIFLPISFSPECFPLLNQI